MDEQTRMRIERLERQIAAMEHGMRRQYQRHMSTHGIGRLIETDDSDVTQTLQIKLRNSELIDKIPNHQQFGFASNMPPDGDVTISFLEGNRSKGIVVATGHQTYRQTGTPVGGVTVYDKNAQTLKFDAGTNITMTGKGTIIIQCPDLVHIITHKAVVDATDEVTVNTNTATINANDSITVNTNTATINAADTTTVNTNFCQLTAPGGTSIDGDVAVNGEIIATGDVIASSHVSLTTHLHTLVTTGTEISGPPE